MIKAFANTIPKIAGEYSRVWKERCLDPNFADPMTVLGSSSDDADRDDAMEQLIAAAEEAGLPGWRLSHTS